MKCSNETCERDAFAKGMCLMHYKRQWRRSKPEWQGRFERTVEERLFERVKKTASCWLWTGPVNHAGYGQIGHDGRLSFVHRVAHELYKGPIPAGFHLDHLCRVRACVNPDHLEAVTVAENNRRSAKVRAERPECSHGHPRATYAVRHSGALRCLACNNRRGREWRKANLAHSRAYMRDYMRQRRKQAKS